MRPLVVGLVATLVLAAGCVELVGPEDQGPGVSGATTLLLRFTLVNEGADSGADAGHHCGTVRFEGGKAVVEEDTMEELGAARPFLIVDPELEGGWASIGSEPYALRLAATVDAGVYDDDQDVGVVGWETEGNRSWATLDGDRVALPHEWVVQDDDGQWRAEARLSLGPDRVATFDAGPCA